MIEFEKTFLPKYLPKDLQRYPSKEIVDMYIPASDAHPYLRLRKNGDRYEITKKFPVKDGDSSEQEEHTIALREVEFNDLLKADGKMVRKIRYQYPLGSHAAEIDLFQDDLQGLVVVDIEFKTAEEKDGFQMPEFCLADVTQEKAFAGGMLCGKKYTDIESILGKFAYKKIIL